MKRYERDAGKKLDILFIVPPFYSLNSPPVEPGMMKALVADRGYRAEVLYANLFFQREIPPELAKELNSFFSMPQWIEFVFASEAFPECNVKHALYKKKIEKEGHAKGRKLLELREKTSSYISAMSKIIEKKEPGIVWIYTAIRQLTASIAMARTVKEINPSIVTALGGPHCRLPMGQAILDTAPFIDYLFSGEAEWTVPEFCCQVLKGSAPEQKIIHCPPVEDLDLLPLPDYSDYFEQLFRNFLRTSGIAVETGRGCWWGKKTPCLFCGLHTIYREKSPERIKWELRDLINRYPSTNINFKDLIMPPGIPQKVFSDFQSPGPLSLFYELKPVTTGEDLAILKARGLNTCQAGIESLSTRVLTLLGKGVCATENIRFLRDCAALEIDVLWNLLYAVPFEREEDYREMMTMMPRLFHLPPPKELRRVYIQRFSPLYENCEAYEIKNRRPFECYSHIFPDNANINNLALFFEGDYSQAFRNKKLMKDFSMMIGTWKKAYTGKKASLFISAGSHSRYELIDSRGTQTVCREITSKHILLIKMLEKGLEPESLEKTVQKNNLKKELIQLIKWECIYQTKEKWISLVVQKKQLNIYKKNICI